MTDELIAVTNGQVMGSVRWDRKRDQLSFDYDDAWRSSGQSFPLSLSMPMATPLHGHEVVNAFLWGLLPDNDGILNSWGQRFHVSPRNPFKLLCHVGEDCAGAVQLVLPDKIPTQRTGRVQWLDEAALGDRMRLLIQDHSASRISTDRGHFSLAGAQPKSAFHYDPKTNRWGVPSGTMPTTHIFKPANGAYDGYVENEHFCMCLARALGMAVAVSGVRYFGDIPVIVIERYDRARNGSSLIRIHQEDMCQALARMPQQKYQNQGGPSAAEIVGMIRQNSSARDSDVSRFLDALMFSWFIAGTDAHAKNYSFLIAARGIVRLAPLYDLSSALPYPLQVNPRKATLAMKIGGKYKLQQIGPREWKKAAGELRVDEAVLRERMHSLAVQIPSEAARVAQELKSKGLAHDVIPRIVQALTDRCQAMAGGV